MTIDEMMKARQKQLAQNDFLKRKALGATMPETRGLLQYTSDMHQSQIFDQFE